MQCRRDRPASFDVIDRRSIEACPCLDCDEERRVRQVLDSAEFSLRRVITQLLCAGMMPDDIVSAVRFRARRKKSRAIVLTRVELTCQAGYWLSRPEWADQLDQVDVLRKGTGFRIGTTIPGWLHTWFARKGGGDLDTVTDGVLDVWMALAHDLESSADLLDPFGEERARAGMSDSIVLPSPFRVRTPDASNKRGHM